MINDARVTGYPQVELMSALGEQLNREYIKVYFKYTLQDEKRLRILFLNGKEKVNYREFTEAPKVRIFSAIIY